MEPTATDYAARETTLARAGFSRLAWFFLDKLYISSRLKYKTRTDCKLHAACYTYDELDNYEKNTFSRNYVFATTLGLSLYLTIFVFMIVPQLQIVDSSRSIVEEVIANESIVPVLAVTIAFVAILRSAAVLYLNAYFVVALQTTTLAMAVLGNFEYECNRYNSSPYTGGGHFALTVLEGLSDLIHLEDNRFRSILYVARCEHSFKRLSAVNLLNEIINLAFSIRLLTL